MPLGTHTLRFSLSLLLIFFIRRAMACGLAFLIAVGSEIMVVCVLLLDFVPVRLEMSGRYDVSETAVELLSLAKFV